ncbi:hypothetical protein D3C75_952330 [compost metagenome]
MLVRSSVRSLGTDSSAWNSTSPSISRLLVTSSTCRLGKRDRNALSSRCSCSSFSLSSRMWGRLAVIAGNSGSCILSRTSVPSLAEPSRRQASLRRLAHLCRSSRSKMLGALLYQVSRLLTRFCHSVSSCRIAEPRSSVWLSSNLRAVIWLLFREGKSELSRRVATPVLIESVPRPLSG